jgi:hypothetical protein
MEKFQIIERAKYEGKGEKLYLKFDVIRNTTGRGEIQDGPSGFCMLHAAAGRPVNKSRGRVVWYYDYASRLQTSDKLLEEEGMIKLLQGNENEKATY